MLPPSHKRNFFGESRPCLGAKGVILLFPPPPSCCCCNYWLVHAVVDRLSASPLSATIATHPKTSLQELVAVHLAPGNGFHNCSSHLQGMLRPAPTISTAGPKVAASPVAGWPKSASGSTARKLKCRKISGP